MALVEVESKPTLSVVIEWENTKNSATDRAELMMRELVKQLEEQKPRLGGPTELILVHDVHENKASDILAAIEKDLAGFSGTITTVEAEGLDYYQQKTFGARRAKGDAILFVDSDVVPQAGWLKSLLDCYLTEKADVVGGATCITTDTTYARSMALFWFFPTRVEAGSERRRTNHFYANNVLFRAEVFKETPFPEDSEMVRGTCQLLVKRLAERQRSIFSEPAAFVTHPPPNGIKHFAFRALCAGHDYTIWHKNQTLKQIYWRWKSRHRDYRDKIQRRAVHLDAPRSNVIGALGVAVAYNTLETIGELATLATGKERHLIQKYLRV